jgi:hypothetical protein
MKEGRTTERGSKSQEKFAGSHLQLPTNDFSNGLEQSLSPANQGLAPHSLRLAVAPPVTPSFRPSATALMRAPASSLTVNQPGDQFEQEAENVADQIMRMAAPVGVQRRCATCDEADHKLQRKCTKCEEEQGKLYRKAYPEQGRRGAGVGSSTAPPIVHEILRSTGQPLDWKTRAFMEPRFGHDFSKVRVHTDERAAQSAKAVSALAYTVGHQVVFDAGQYSPESIPGQRLLAHELSHVVQQDGAKPAHRTLPQSLTRISRRLYRDSKPKSAVSKPPPIAGGNILYVGMNNYKPEVAQLGNTYAGSSVTVTQVTVTEHEEKTQVGGKTFDLTTPDGIAAFANGLPLNGEQVDVIEKLLTDQRSANRDDLAHVISVYANTETDNADRLSRVILSGHSWGESVYNEDVKGAIEFKALITLADLFPKAASQTKHLLVLACLAGEEDVIKNVYQKAFPNLQTFWGWTRATCPTGAGAAAALEKWTKLTDKNPTTLPLPPTTQANWAMGSYQTNEPVDAKSLMDGLRADESKFTEFFSGAKASVDAHSGFLFDYYQRARTAALHTSEVTGADHDYAQLHADQSYRLRFWPGMVSNFWKVYGTTVKTGYGTAATPNYAAMSRKDALAAIANFDSVSTASDKEKSEARRLLKALQNLDSGVLDGTWITP